MNIIIYLIVTAVFLHFVLKKRNTGEWATAAFAMIITWLWVVSWIAFTLIWGGFFWW